MSGCSCYASSHDIVSESIPEGMFSFGVEIELIHVKIFEGKIECLCGKVSNDIDKIAFIVSPPSFLLIQPPEAIDDASVRFFDEFLLDERCL